MGGGYTLTIQPQITVWKQNTHRAFFIPGFIYSRRKLSVKCRNNRRVIGPISYLPAAPACSALSLTRYYPVVSCITCEATVCVCVCVREREGGEGRGERERERLGG